MLEDYLLDEIGEEVEAEGLRGGNSAGIACYTGFHTWSCYEIGNSSVLIS